MPNTMRWRYGDTRPVMMPVDADTVVEIGDLMYAVDGVAFPASSLEDAGSEAANQEAFHDAFIGVAMQCSPEGSADPIRVATSGVFEFVCPSSSFDVGDLLGVDEAASGTALEDQVVAAVATANLAVGRCARRVNPAATRVLASIESTLMAGGVQVAA